MKFKKYRYFFSLFETQEKWLNKMSSKGYRLINTTKLTYDFEPCDNNEYEYCIEFTAHKSNKSIDEYKDFLEQMGYKVYTKNININYSFGKIVWRPYGKGKGQIATNPGSYNKELLIIEKKKDGKPFNIYSNYEDLINYYKPLRNMCLFFLVFDLIMLTLSCISSIFMIPLNVFEKILLSSISILLIIPISKYNSKTNE